MFLKNAWYVAALIDEIGDRPLPRIILNEPLVLFRTREGRAAALEDRCCHRHAPLSEGKVNEAGIQCGYHGLVFAADGRCVEVPGQTAIPPGASIPSYPTLERYGWVWIWMGDPARADEASIPDFSLIDDLAWCGAGERLAVQCAYQLVIDNLLDLSHLTFLHARTIGTGAVAETPVTTDRAGDAVRVTRWMLDVAPPPTFRKVRHFEGNIDRWQIATAAPPCYVWLEVGGADAGTGAPDGNRGQGIERWNMNVVTPETETSAHMFWTECRNFAIDDESVTELVFQQIHDTLLEDIEMLEAQQRMLDLMPDAPMIDINVDAGSIQARRILDQLVEAELAAAT